MSLKAIFSKEIRVNNKTFPTGDEEIFDISSAINDMNSSERELLLCMLRGNEKDYRFIAKLARFNTTYIGPYSVIIDEQEVRDYIKNNNLDDKARYVIAGDGVPLWAYTFSSEEGEVDLKFVFDRREERMISVLIKCGNPISGIFYNEINYEAKLEFETYIKMDFADALNNPFNWDLLSSDEHPDWSLENNMMMMM